MVLWSNQNIEETPLASVSEWVLSRVEEVSKILGLSFEGLEDLAWELFVELEKREAAQLGEGTHISKVREEKIHREVKNLKWGLSYGRKGVQKEEVSNRKTCGYNRVSS